MKKTSLIILSLFAVFTLFAVAGKLHTDTYKVDVKQSSMQWFAEKVGGKHNGTILLKGGNVSNNHGLLSGILEIDMATIVNTDIENETYKAKLENHLKSEDFFDVTKFPTSKFVVKSIVALTETKAEGPTHRVTGDLTLKDKTNSISFDAIVKLLSDKITVSGSAIVDRSKFDVRYRSKSFFADIGDKMIYDDFTLQFNIVAVK